MSSETFNWRPSATPQTLIARAEILRNMRAFFEQRGIIEVETPLLSRATITDPHLEGFCLTVHHETAYLQTSPEYAMKRLLAAGLPDIYQLGKVFRVDDAARYHNPEFTMLEWYRLGYDLNKLMDEVDALFQHILSCKPAKRITYQNSFAPLNINPFTATKEDCQHIAYERGMHVSEEVLSATKDTWLQLLFSTYIEPDLGFDMPVFIYDFPASQASLATLDPNNPAIAKRVEVFVNGMELGNGFDELQDYTIQAERFQKDNALRRELGAEQKPIDPLLLAALEHGLPQCSGIAIGVDRLIMCALNKQRIGEVLAFDWPRA